MSDGSNYVSPYLLQPLRSFERCQRERESRHLDRSARSARKIGAGPTAGTAPSPETRVHGDLLGDGHDAG